MQQQDGVHRVDSESDPDAETGDGLVIPTADVLRVHWRPFGFDLVISS